MVVGIEVVNFLLGFKYGLLIVSGTALGAKLSQTWTWTLGLACLSSDFAAKTVYSVFFKDSLEVVVSGTEAGATWSLICKGQK